MNRLISMLAYLYEDHSKGVGLGECVHVRQFAESWIHSVAMHRYRQDKLIIRSRQTCMTGRARQRWWGGRRGWCSSSAPSTPSTPSGSAPSSSSSPSLSSCWLSRSAHVSLFMGINCIPEYGDFSTAEIGLHRLMNIFLIYFSLVPKINRHGLMLCHVMPISF